MAKISLICEQCGGNIILDDSHEIGTCEHCFAQFVVKQDHIVKNITQNITKYVYGYEGKDVEELLNDGYQLKQLCDDRKANAKFKRAIDLEPNCWSAWLGYASTGGDRSGYLSVVPAYIQAYNVAADEQQETETFVDMTRYLPDSDLRAAFIRAFNLASHADRHKIFELVSGVLGCDGGLARLVCNGQVQKNSCKMGRDAGRIFHKTQIVGCCCRSAEHLYEDVPPCLQRKLRCAE